MSKHTPGPWGTDLSEHDHPYQDIVVRAGTRTICRVWIDDAPVQYYNAAQLANARLIAAAPDLLEALNTWLEQYSAEEYEGCPEVVQTRAALAKASGTATQTGEQA